MSPEDYKAELQKALEEFDFASSSLALHQTLELATQANLASLRWADLIYSRRDKILPKEAIQHYIRDVDGCMGILERMRHRFNAHEKTDMSPEDYKKIRRPSSHIGSYIDQMRLRKGLVNSMQPPTNDSY